MHSLAELKAELILEARSHFEDLLTHAEDDHKIDPSTSEVIEIEERLNHTLSSIYRLKQSKRQALDHFARREIAALTPPPSQAPVS